MCLTLKKGNLRVKIATEDIVVYKLIESYDNEPTKAGKYYTPFRYCEVVIGSTYTSKITFGERQFGVNRKVIKKGLHSFGNLDDCIGLAEYYFRSEETEHVCKCLIPKGSRYYQGDFEDYKNCYASNALTYVEIISTH